jgi:hypothetical protein
VVQVDREAVDLMVQKVNLDLLVKMVYQEYQGLKACEVCLEFQVKRVYLAKQLLVTKDQKVQLDLTD